MHKSRLGEIVIDCRTDDLMSEAQFWRSAPGYPLPQDVDVSATSIRLVTPPGEVQVIIQRVSHDPRAHLDIETDPIRGGDASGISRGGPRGQEGRVGCHASAKRTSTEAEWRPEMNKNTICLWYDGTALDAARFYARTFPNSSVGRVMKAPGDYPDGNEGDVLTVEFTVAGIPCIGLNGGSQFPQTEAFSFQIATDDQDETDRLWNAIVDNGGTESACGWCKDKWGVNWQITPRALTDAVNDPDRKAAKRAFDAMMAMSRIDIAKIEAARRG